MTITQIIIDLGDRVDELSYQKAKAQQNLSLVKDKVAKESWCGRISELQGRIEEINSVKRKLEKYNENLL